jgi:excisionase family DNA binding protein
MPGASGDQTYLSTSEAAGMCLVDRRTLLRWVDRGLLQSHRPAGGRYRILRRDLRQFMRDHRMPVPRALLEPARIAIVDDDLGLLRSLERMVSDHLPDAIVKTASDGFGAGVLVASFRPHVMLLDIVMPGISGVDVCREICATPELAGTAVVIVSGNLTSAITKELLTIGARRCISKPFDSAQILDVVTELSPQSITT